VDLFAIGTSKFYLNAEDLSAFALEPALVESHLHLFDGLGREIKLLAISACRTGNEDFVVLSDVKSSHGLEPPIHECSV